jgi:hypothetical protein
MRNSVAPWEGAALPVRLVAFTMPQSNLLSLEIIALDAKVEAPEQSVSSSLTINCRS